MNVRSALPLVLSLMLLMPSTPLLAKDTPSLKVKDAKNMAGVTNVVVASFSIAFVTEKTDAAFAGRRNIGKAMGAITKARLAGVSAADFQAITDAAYADFVARLTAAGYTVGDRAVMIADKQMAKVQYLPSGTAGSLTFGKDSEAKAVFYGPTTFGPNALMKGETGNGGSGGIAGRVAGGMFGSLKSLSSIGGPATAKVYYSIYSKQPTVSVQYVIDFADVERYGASYTTLATVGLTASLAVVETLSDVKTINAKGASGAVTLAQAVAVPGNFGSMKDTTTGGQKLDNVAGAVIGGLFGSGSNTYKHITFTADPAPYRAGATEAAKNTNALIVTEIAARR